MAVRRNKSDKPAASLPALLLVQSCQGARNQTVLYRDLASACDALPPFHRDAPAERGEDDEFAALDADLVATLGTWYGNATCGDVLDLAPLFPRVLLVVVRRGCQLGRLVAYQQLKYRVHDDAV